MFDLISLPGKLQVFYLLPAMSEVESTFRLRPGDLAPSFQLPEPDGRIHSLEELRGEKGTLVFFTCNHCPYVIHLASAVGRLAEEIAASGISTVAIMPNDVENYPEDHPDRMGTFASESGWAFPYLYDESQEVAKAWSAACTPDFFLFDADHRLVYRGQLDDSRPNSEIPVTGKDLRGAVAALAAGNPVPSDQTPSLGCGIKWIPGQAPAYTG